MMSAARRCQPLGAVLLLSAALLLCAPRACEAAAALRLGRQRAPTALGPQPGNATSAVLKSGLRVVLCGLQAHPALNGHAARILKYNLDSGRYTVRLEGKSRAQVDAAHLLPLPAADDGAGAGAAEAAAAGLCPHAASPASAASAPPPATHALAAAAAGGAGHPVVDNEHFFEGCSEACDACFVDHLMACYAVCHEGCQMYCDESTAGMPGCSTEEYWSATPGGPPACTWDDDKQTSCRRYRSCESESSDGCPEAYLY